MPAPKKKHRAQKAPAQPRPFQQYLAGMMNAGVPLLDRLALARLEHNVSNGDPQSASLLARGLDEAHSEKIRRAIRVALGKVSQTACVDALWFECFRSRSGSLQQILLERKQPASAPPEVRAFSLLKLDSARQLEGASPDLVLPLIKACDDVDPQVAAGARRAIGCLQQEDALDILCAHWARTRAPLLEHTILSAGYLAHDPLDVRVLTALKLNQPDRIDLGAAEIVAPLLQASRDRDGEIAARADYLLRNGLSGAALTEFCLRWSQTRDAQVETILVQCQLLPRQPQPLRLLCALKLGRLEIAQRCPPRHLDVLLSACQDADPLIGANARGALCTLQSPESREALCQNFIDSGNEAAGQAAVEAGYLPAATEPRAVFLFLTGQWEAYETLDFDRRIMRAFYATARPELRQRLRRTVQSAGRIEFLSILNGVDNRPIDQAEAGLVVQMLSKNKNWDELWRLARELSLSRSIEILKILSANGWEPQQPEERPVYRQLTELAARPLPASAGELAGLLPPAVPLATLKVHGRVNDIAFAPGQPLLALATGSRKVVLWDYRKAQVSKVLLGFDHSVGQVTFQSDGQLVCAERTNSAAPCDIYLLDGQEYYRLGSHTASVTSLLRLPDGSLLSTGRDYRIILWNLTSRCQIAWQTAPAWPRCAAISRDGRLAALVSDRVQVIELPGLNFLTDLAPVVNQGPRGRTGVARCAAFAPTGYDLLTGQMNGQVIHYSEIISTQRREKRILGAHNGSVVGICFRPQNNQAITAGSEGELHFIDWPSGEERRRLAAPLPDLTSLEISPDGRFMATGSQGNAFTLWDLRTQDLPAVIDLPVASFQPEHLAAVESLAQAKELPLPLRNALSYLEALLQYRYRFDIQIGEISRIQPGEFDILVDESCQNSGYNG